jgi:phosphatidyl-myo-inositol alpha-mannosyltransferase
LLSVRHRGAGQDPDSRLAWTDRITYTGHLSHSQVLATMTECDVLVDPREINSFGNCVYEAMTLGVPIVASDVACNAQGLGHDERGLLVAAGDSAALARGVSEILLDETRVKTLTSAGESYAASLENLIGTDQIAARLEAAYATVITQ